MLSLFKRFAARIAVSLIGTLPFLSCDFAGEAYDVQDSLVVTDQNFDFLKDPGAFTLKEELSGGALELLGKNRSIKKLLTAFYSPDTYTGPEEALGIPPDYIITGVESIHGTFLSDSGTCEERTMLLCSRGDFIEEEYYDLFFLAIDQKGEVVVSGKEVFEGSRGANLTRLEVSELALPVRHDCSLLMVSSQTENGEPDLHKESWIEILMASGKGFRSLFRLQLEETSIEDYVAAEEESQRSVSKIQSYEILPSSAHGLFDIRVMYSITEDEKVVRRGEDVYRFDGHYYVKNQPL